MIMKHTLILVSIILLLLFVDLRPPLAPEKLLISVFNSKGQPSLAQCKADIITKHYTIDDRPLTLSKFKDPNNIYYELDTNMTRYRGKFNIRIVCITDDGVSYSIINNTHLPCHMIDGGKTFQCT